jgi:hypothetical protein
VKLPGKVVGWFYFKYIGLKHKKIIMSILALETISLETVRKALNFVIRQDLILAENLPANTH